MNTTRSLCGPGLAALALGATALSAQVQVHEIVGATFNQNLGMVMIGAGDLDADQVPDLLLGSPEAFVPGIGVDTGFVEAYSGRDASVLFRIDGDDDDWFFGTALAALGDLDGDGFADFAVSAIPFPDFDEPPDPNGGLVRLYSGADRSVVWELYQPQRRGFGVALAPAGDFDGDGDPDLLIGDTGCSSVGCSEPGRVVVVDANTGQTVTTVVRGKTTARFGSAVAGLGDVDGDGYSDFVAGAPGQSIDDIQSGAVWVISSVSASTLFNLAGVDDLEQFGASVARIGDANGDGVTDFAVGAPFGTSGYVGDVRLFSGADGTQLVDVQGGGIGGQQFGISIAGIGDQDGDGLADFVVGDPKDNPAGGVCCSGAAFVYSGLDGTLLETHVGVSAGFSEYWLLGHVVANVGDLNGDGLVDWAASTPYRTQEKGGAAVFLTGCPATVEYCSAKTNSLGCVPSLSASGAASAALPTLSIDASNVLNQRNGLLFYGLSGRAALPFFGGTLCVAPPLRRTGVQSSLGNPPPANDCSGAYALDFGAIVASGSQPALVPGQQVNAQYWMRDPQNPDGTGVVLTTAAELYVCE